MTEAEWITCAKPGPMLSYLHSRSSLRKERLFACACCRRAWHLIRDDRCRSAVDISEKFADGLADADELKAALTQAQNVYQEQQRYDAPWHWASACICAVEGKTGSAHEIRVALWRLEGEQMVLQETGNQCALIHDIFGDPFRPLSADPACLTPTVVSLAQAIYTERAFDRMPILADALEEAGCVQQDILSHCCESREHVRGCWVVDSILGKA